MYSKHPLKFSFFLALFGILIVFFNILPIKAKAQAENTGSDPLQNAVFFGESTTTHLRSRGGIPADRVWANESGTMRLDSTLFSKPLTDPHTGDHISFHELLSRTRPSHMVLSFGLNGIVGFAENLNSYLGNYRKLIEKIQETSPETRITVQSVYPVAQENDQSNWRFSLSPKEINRRILLLNGALSELCETLEGVCYVDTASALTDSSGYLKTEFTTDGIHLTERAYDEILRVLRASISAHISSE